MDVSFFKLEITVNIKFKTKVNKPLHITLSLNKVSKFFKFILKATFEALKL